MHATQGFELLIGMALAIVLLHFLAHRLRLPPAVALLLGGGALAFIPGLPAIELDPELVLVIFLPPLLMDGAWFTALAPFRRHLAGIASLAIGAVLFTAAVVAVAVKLVVPDLPWAACLALGAIVSPPDAVSARAVLQRVRLPRRLGTLLEGESLLNDATGLVLFRVAVAATLTGSVHLGDALGSFALLLLGGAAVGGAIGLAWVRLVRRLRDETLIIAVSILLCWVAYLAAEAVHVSGVIATVTTGLVCGWHQHEVLNASARVRGTAFWTTMIFLMEAAVFILIGLSLREVVERVGGVEVVLRDMAWPLAAVILAVTLARFAWIFGADGLLALLRRAGWHGVRPMGARGALVMSWAGMRGVVTLAVALSLPEEMPGRDMMLVAAFAVILVTVLVQGTTLGLVIRLAGLREEAGAHPPLDLFAAEAAMLRAQAAAVERLAHAPDGTLLHPRLLESYRRRARLSTEMLDSPEERDAGIAAHYTVVLAAVAAGRAELVRLHRARQIDDETLHDLERDLDLEELMALSAQGDA